MRVGFLVDGQGLYKVFGPVIDYALGQSAEVSLLLWDAEIMRTGPKSYGRAEPGNVPVFLNGHPRIFQWDSPQDLAETCIRERLQAIISVWLFPHFIDACRELRRRGVRWIALQHATEHTNLPLESFAEPDATCFFSEYWLEGALARIRSLTGSSADRSETCWRGRMAVTGCPELDVWPRLDARQLRRQYGVPEGRPVVVWQPYEVHEYDLWELLVLRRDWRPRRLGRAILQHRWDLLLRAFHEPSYNQLLRAMRSFCNHNEAFLISKSRIKDRPSRFDQTTADLFTHDRAYYPPTILEVLAMADLCIHILSTTALEAAHGGVPGLCVVLPSHAGAFTHPIYGPKWKALTYRADGSVWNYPGVSWMMPLDKACRQLGHMRLDDFKIDPARRAEYICKYLGFDDYQNSARVWEVVETLVGNS